MALRPVAKHRHEVNEDGLATVFIPKFKNRYLIKFLVPSWKSPEFRIKLDELGSAVWLSIDGKKNVDSICLELINKLGEKVHPAEERVTKFLSTLYYQGFITFRELEELDEQRQF
jgi:hypothetical protein